MTINDHEDEALPEPDGHHFEAMPDNSAGVIGDLHSLINREERFDFVLSYYLRGEAVGVDRIKDKASAAAAMTQARASGYDEIQWSRVDSGANESNTALGDFAAPVEVNSIRGVEMPSREAGLFRTVVGRLRSRWANPFFPHDGE
jgi:hypothetical protein